MPQQDPGGNIGVEPDPVVIGPQPGPGPVAGPIGGGGGFSPDVEVVQPMPPPSPPQMINIDDSPDVGPRMMGHPGVSIASDFMPLVNSTRSRLLELNVEYRDNMIHLKVPDHESISTVKTLLQEKTGVPPCQQELRGWKGEKIKCFSTFQF